MTFSNFSNTEDPNLRESQLNGHYPLEVYTAQGEKVGRVIHILRDEAEQVSSFRVELDRLNHRQVLLPLKHSRIDQANHRIYLTGMNKAEVEALPVALPSEHNISGQNISRQNTSRQNISGQNTVEIHQTNAFSTEGTLAESNSPSQVETNIPVETSTSLESPVIKYYTYTVSTSIDQANHQTNPLINPQNEDGVKTDGRVLPVHSVVSPVVQEEQEWQSVAPAKVVEEEKVRLLEERIVVGQKVRKVGDIVARKEIVTETKLVEVPVRYERLIVEQVSPEYKQLATIDLKQETETTLPDPAVSTLGDRLSSNVRSPLEPAPTNLQSTHDPTHPTIQGEFTSPAMLSRLLNAIAQTPDHDCEKIRIEITLKSPKRQKVYQDWLERCRLNQGKEL